MELYARFVHDGWHVVNELDETERVHSSYIRGHEWLTQLDDQGDVAYVVNNIHGDVTHLTGQQGEILNAYTYDAFGNMLSSREQRVNPFRYAGEMQDALTGHYYLRARFYNPIIARFTQEDTYRGDGLNLYAYVANNPIRYVDPSGYMCEDKGNVHGVNNNINVNEFTEITLKYIPGMPKYQFDRKAEALKKLGDEGMLVKASNPVQRDRSVTKAYREDLIKRIWSQYGKDNRDFANKLIDKITDHRKMQPDHIWELQLSGPDTVSNLKFLDSFTNEHIGMRQIWPQIRNLPTGTKIKIKIEY